MTIRGLGFVLLIAALVGAAQGQADTGFKFEVYQDTKSEHRWRLKSGNGQIVAVASEGYKAKADSLKAIASIKEGLDKLKFEVYEDTGKEYRWRLKAGNGEILATAGESYKARADAEKGYEFLKSARNAPVVEGKP